MQVEVEPLVDPVENWDTKSCHEPQLVGRRIGPPPPEQIEIEV